MTDQKVKKRGWVKNAAIIFLAVMLVLTFFSNTIMKHSLPEVAAQYVQSGTISAKIRGTGTVAANESYEVKSEQAREVLSVPVKVGDQIKVGDTLVLYSDAESKTLTDAQDALDALILAYQKALINSNSSDYTKENRDIQLAQAALDKAKAEKDKYDVSVADIANAKANVNRAKADVQAQQSKVDNLTDQLSGMTQGSDNSSTYAAIQNKQAQITEAQKDLASDQLTYGEAYAELTDLAAKYKAAYEKDNPSKGDVSIYTKALVSEFQKQLSAKADPVKLPDGMTSSNPSAASATAMVTAYTEINGANEKITSLTNELNGLQSSINYGDSNYSYVKKQLTDAKTQLTALQTAQTNFETTLKDLEDKNTKLEAAQTAVETAQKSLEDLMFSLAEKKKTDGKTQASEALDLAAQRKQIEEKEKELADLKKGGAGAKVESKVNGIVAAINITAGKTAEANAVLMTIEVPDMGYGISFAVTTEQSKKVALGDTAEVSNYYGGDPITATLVNIKSDPQNPGTKKLLTFKIQGEVESGTQLSLALGERGGNYETIVPNSSIRSDNNGKFVLAIVAKSSPLGNRYIATRIDVQVLATDDVNSAVSGGITTSDMVITTSTKPIEPGTQVRLADQ